MLATTKPEDLFASRATLPGIAEAVVAYVLANFAEEISLDDLAREAGLSRFNFCRRFHRECGLPPMRWLWTFRAALAAEFIAIDPRWSLTDVAFSCGFTSSAHFSRSFRAAYGMSPSQYRKGALARLDGTKTQGREAVFNDPGVALKALERTLGVEK
jgi:AraC family transcriptional regulator